MSDEVEKKTSPKVKHTTLVKRECLMTGAVDYYIVVCREDEVFIPVSNFSIKETVVDFETTILEQYNGIAFLTDSPATLPS